MEPRGDTQQTDAAARVDDDVLFRAGAELVAEARRSDVLLKLIGALGIRAACPASSDLFEILDRRTGDIDLAGLAKQWTPIVRLFERVGYSFDERRALLHGSGRLIFFHEAGFRVDVFLDRLRMCHELDLRPGLKDGDGIAMPPTELLLQKLQIVELTRKDVVDVIVLLREHEVGGEDAIDGGRVAAALAADWGFYYTAVQNLVHVRDDAHAELPQLAENDREMVRLRTEALLSRIEEQPKSVRWKARRRIGTRSRWYQEVGDLDR